jgi:hypothetical protein
MVHTRKHWHYTSSNGRVSLKQLSQTSLTARSAAARSGHAGLAATEIAARRRTQACRIIPLPWAHGHQECEELTWCCFEKATKPRLSSRVYRQSPLKLFARILKLLRTYSYADRRPCLPRYMRGAAGYSN